MFIEVEKKYLTAAETRALLGGISKSHFHKIKKERALPTYSVAGFKRCLYLVDDVLALITKREEVAL